MDPTVDNTPSAFPSTRISLVQLAASPGQPGYREAWERFFRSYWPPLYRWLRRKGNNRQDALDLLQDFFLKGLDGPMLGKYDPSKGRLRNFLLVCLKNHRIAEHRGEEARPEHKGINFLHIQGTDHEPVDPDSLDPDRAFDVEWARRVFSHAIAAVEARLQAQTDDTSRRVLREWVLCAQRPPAEAAARAFGLATGSMYVRATRLRQAIREELHAQVSSYSGDDKSSRDEVEEILKLLTGDAR